MMDDGTEVCATNPDEVGNALDALIKVLQDMKSDLKSGGAIDRVFESANAWRDTLLIGRS